MNKKACELVFTFDNKNFLSCRSIKSKKIVLKKSFGNIYIGNYLPYADMVDIFINYSGQWTRRYLTNLDISNLTNLAISKTDFHREYMNCVVNVFDRLTYLEGIYEKT